MSIAYETVRQYIERGNIILCVLTKNVTVRCHISVFGSEIISRKGIGKPARLDRI